MPYIYIVCTCANIITKTCMSIYIYIYTFVYMGIYIYIEHILYANCFHPRCATGLPKQFICSNYWITRLLATQHCWTRMKHLGTNLPPRTLRAPRRWIICIYIYIYIICTRVCVCVCIMILILIPAVKHCKSLCLMHCVYTYIYIYINYTHHTHAPRLKKKCRCIPEGAST